MELNNRNELWDGFKTGWAQFAQVWLAASALLCAFLMLCYWLRPDSFAAFTILPVWCWTLTGVVLTALVWNRARARKVAVVTLMWLAFLLIFADEPRSLLRALTPLSVADPERSLRVVSLNCSGGDLAAAMEVAKWNPDVVLLQESPSRADVEQLARKMFGENAGFLWGVDCSIIGRGKFTPRALPREFRSFFVQTHVQLPHGQEIELISVRLMTPPFRMDLWSPSSWQAYRENRHLQRTQMDAVKKHLRAISQERAIIIGGDFNAPQGDAVFAALRPRLDDSFTLAGRGWGNTITNEFPVLRIDQIWASAALQPHNVIAQKMQNSDHRSVMADFIWRAD